MGDDIKASPVLLSTEDGASSLNSLCCPFVAKITLMGLGSICKRYFCCLIRDSPIFYGTVGNPTDNPRKMSLYPQKMLIGLVLPLH